MRKIQRVNVSEAAYSSVKQVLLSSKYAPGDRVDIEQLCQELDVSRTPVFDALNRLETEGLVDIVPRRGVYLVTLSEEKAQELYQVREVLEGMATKLAARNLKEKQIDQLKKALEKQGACLSKSDTDGYASATIKFHNIIVEAAGNKTLERMLNAVYSQMEALRLRTLYLPKRLRQSYTEHQRIFQALLKRDPEQCERVAREHIVATTNYALEILGQPKNEVPNSKRLLAEVQG
ncbi:MAG: GntR family transcriptional regulator [Ktedonobacteraceae bacterium]